MRCSPLLASRLSKRSSPTAPWCVATSQPSSRRRWPCRNSFRFRAMPCSVTRMWTTSKSSLPTSRPRPTTACRISVRESTASPRRSSSPSSQDPSNRQCRTAQKRTSPTRGLVLFFVDIVKHAIYSIFTLFYSPNGRKIVARGVVGNDRNGMSKRRNRLVTYWLTTKKGPL